MDVKNKNKNGGKVGWRGGGGRKKVRVKGKACKKKKKNIRVKWGGGGGGVKWEDVKKKKSQSKMGKLQAMQQGLVRGVVMMSWCLMSSDVTWHIRDKLWPMPKHGSIILYIQGNQKARYDGQPRTATSTLTQLLNYERGGVTKTPGWSGDGEGMQKLQGV